MCSHENLAAMRHWWYVMMSVVIKIRVTITTIPNTDSQTQRVQYQLIKKCPRSVQEVSKKCPRIVQEVSKKCPRSVQEVSKNCPRSVQEVSKINFQDTQSHFYVFRSPTWCARRSAPRSAGPWSRWWATNGAPLEPSQCSLGRGGCPGTSAMAEMMGSCKLYKLYMNYIDIYSIEYPKIVNDVALNDTC